MNIKEKDVLSDESLGGQTSDKTMLSTRRKPYEYQLIVNLALLNNSFTSNTQ